MRKVAFYASLVLVTLCALYLVYVFRAVVILFLLSLFTASAVRPVVLNLTRRGLSSTRAIFITYAVGIVLIGLSLFALARIAVPELIDLLNTTINRYQSAHRAWTSGPAFQQSLAAFLPSPQTLLDSLAADEGTLLAQALLSAAGSIGSALAGIAVIVVLSIYWTVDRLRFEGLWLSLLPASIRGRVRRLWEDVQDGVGEYIRSQGIQAFLAIVLLAGGYTVMGLGHPLLLALLGAVAWLIPVVGFLFAAVAALLVGLVHSPILGILAAVFTVVVFIALQMLVEEKWLKVQRDYSYLLVALLMIPLADTYGFVGLIAAPPLAVSIESLLEAIFDTRRQELTTATTETRLDELAQRLETLQADMSGREAVITPELSSLLARLESLLTRTRTAMEESNNPSTIAD